jgi:hypothetical protein
MPTDEIDFEDFDRERMRPLQAPAISIHRDGNLLINAASYRALGEPVAVILSYGRNRPVVGIRAVEAGTRGAHHVGADSHNHSHVIRATAFCNHDQIDRTQARRYGVARYGERFGIDLTAPIAITSPVEGTGGTTKKKGK